MGQNVFKTVQPPTATTTQSQGIFTKLFFQSKTVPKETQSSYSLVCRLQKLRNQYNPVLCRNYIKIGILFIAWLLCAITLIIMKSEDNSRMMAVPVNKALGKTNCEIIKGIKIKWLNNTLCIIIHDCRHSLRSACNAGISTIEVHFGGLHIGY